MRNMLKFIILMAMSVGCFYVSLAYAASGSGISGIATNVTGSFSAIAKLITAGAFVAGLGFALAAILKFKAHKDNPTQIPVGTPIALLFIAVALLFLPTLFKGIGTSVFGSASAGGISGVSSI